MQELAVALLADTPIDLRLVIAVDPVILRLGPAALRWHGVALALGIAAGLALALREARQRGLDEDATYACALWAILAGALGARALHVVDKLDYYLQNPALLAGLGQGGLALWGAVLAGGLAALLAARRLGLPSLRLADAAAPGLLLGQVVGRLGSLLNGDAWGAPTGGPWGLVYTHPDAALPPASLGVPVHPYALYEIAWHLALLGLLWPLRRRLRADGALFAVYLLGLAAGRLALSSIREESIWLLGLQQAQLLAIPVLLLTLPWLVYLLTLRPGTLAPAEGR